MLNTISVVFLPEHFDISFQLIFLFIFIVIRFTNFENVRRFVSSIVCNERSKIGENCTDRWHVSIVVQGVRDHFGVATKEGREVAGKRVRETDIFKSRGVLIEEQTPYLPSTLITNKNEHF